jgi:epsilon-lactone hydrolase
MPRIRFAGPVFLRISSLLALNGIALATYCRRAFGQRMEPSWNADLEIGVRFWRRQFTLAIRSPDIGRGRAILDSLQTETSDKYDVSTRTESEPRGTWYLPRQPKTTATLLYFHGGGYTFHGAMSRRYAAMLAHRVGARLFAPDYRLTPEHPHPAQAEEAMTAWKFLTRQEDPRKIVLVGDSAGGHMVLMLLLELKTAGRPQPALAIGLCPWTDIGDRGVSLHANDQYDLVQGWMALQFGQWLDPDGRVEREALSPVAHDFSGVAPLYLQAGGREILRDMIWEFATEQKQVGVDIMLDVWPDMPHDFQLFDSTQQASSEALDRIARCVHHRIDNATDFGPCQRTVVAAGLSAR